MFGDMDINALMKQAQELQEGLQRAQDEMQSTTFTASAGGEAVSITINGKGDIEQLAISPQAVDPGDTETLSALIIAAHRAARAQAEEAMAAAMPQVPQIPGFGA